ncbi:MAG: sigma-70 family RNA polymerase sigma factor [Magnetococcus sp. WYHC-3]
MEQAFEILAEQFRPMLITYLNAILRDRSLAEDLTQETLLVAYQEIDKFRKDGNFGAWLRGIARNKARDNARAAMRRPLIVDSRIVEGMEEVYGLFDVSQDKAGSWDERLDVMLECVNKLGGSLREAVLLVYRQGHSLEEAAQALHSTFQAVSQRLFRARNLIRKCVALAMPQVMP